MGWRPPASVLGNTLNTIRSNAVGGIDIWLDVLEDLDPKVPNYYLVCADERGRVLLEIYESDPDAAQTTFENALDFIRDETNGGSRPWDFVVNPEVERVSLSKEARAKRRAQAELDRETAEFQKHLHHQKEEAIRREKEAVMAEREREAAEKRRIEAERKRAEEAEMVSQPDWGRF